MHELFHTEDCGLSLICRCCRAPICERRLARADHLRIARDLWPQTDRWRGGRGSMMRARAALRGLISVLFLKLFHPGG